MSSSPRISPTAIFVGLSVLSAVGLGLVYWQSAAPLSLPPKAALPDSAPPSRPEPVPTPTPTSTPTSSAKEPVAEPPPATPRRLYFRHTGVDNNYGKVGYTLTPGLPAPTYSTLECEVVHFSGGRGSCLQADRGVFTTYAALIFDDQYRPLHTIALEGVPSRTRVAATGKIAALTVFVTGHSYASLDFTTQTLLIDTVTGAKIGDLETFEVTKDGKPFKAADFNFWGVTFTADGTRIYATLSSGGKHYLVTGTVASRRLNVIYENVECPSLSPDGTRIAYKKRLPGERVQWEIQILELATKKEIPLSERRSVDDQLEWLDDRHILYSLPDNATAPSATTDIWMVDADGGGAPRVFLRQAYSPATAR